MERTYRSAAQRRVVLLAVCCCLLVALSLAPQATAQELERRWDLQETPYEDKHIAAKIGCNVRDGLVGCVDSLCQGLLSGVVLLSPWGGFTTKKVVTIVGDVVGLVDNNIATQYVFKGILSRQLLRYGAGNSGIVRGLGGIHDTAYAGPRMPLEAYVGDQYFHTRAYVAPSALTMLGGVVAADILIRPAGHLLMIFGARGTGEAMDAFGIDLIGRSCKPKFF